MIWTSAFCRITNLKVYIMPHIWPKYLPFLIKPIWKFAFLHIIDPKIFFFGNVDLKLFFLSHIWSEHLYFVAKLIWNSIFCRNVVFCRIFDLKICFLSQNWFYNFFFSLPILFKKKIISRLKSDFKIFLLSQVFTWRSAFCHKIYLTIFFFSHNGYEGMLFVR